ncbi:Cytochrome P450 [Rhynchospora pubera]|uniref:Cytochrome P450 n=1 Tax=Rhynchospora pubera TaxID=906938 RepID=A0AAV8EW72_9POAL|nr:Cytochrome P450 [Rhynchospora pubera]KAJ4784964.1 Cytochrome P450 [Rhynchospora pubera]
MDINSHDFTPRIYPHFLKWMSIYGRTFLFWFGPKPLILISDMDLVKKVLFDKSGFYEKPDLPLAVNDLLGKGLPLMNGPDWVRHRRVIKPAFHIDKLKVNLVLLEVLRLYTPAGLVGRTTSQDMELGNIKLLKGTTVVVPISILHRDKDIWGQDADKFNPLRFENGLSKAAKHPNAFLSFAGGPRVCIGQTFAMLQAKIVISMLLQRFSFVISPNYMHKPTETITLHPASGVQVIVKPLQN